MCKTYKLVFFITIINAAKYIKEQQCLTELHLFIIFDDILLNCLNLLIGTTFFINIFWNFLYLYY